MIQLTLTHLRTDLTKTIIFLNAKVETLVQISISLYKYVKTMWVLKIMPKNIMNDASPKKINHFEMDMPQLIHHTTYDKIPLFHFCQQQKKTYLH